MRNLEEGKQEKFQEKGLISEVAGGENIPHRGSGKHKELEDRRVWHAEAAEVKKAMLARE